MCIIHRFVVTPPPLSRPSAPHTISARPDMFRRKSCYWLVESTTCSRLLCRQILRQHLNIIRQRRPARRHGGHQCPEERDAFHQGQFGRGRGRTAARGHCGRVQGLQQVIGGKIGGGRISPTNLLEVVFATSIVRCYST